MGKSSSSCFKGTGCCCGASFFFCRSSCHRAGRKSCKQRQLQRFWNMKNNVLHCCQGRAQCKELNGTDSYSQGLMPLLFLCKISCSQLDINSSCKCSVKTMAIHYQGPAFSLRNCEAPRRASLQKKQCRHIMKQDVNTDGNSPWLRCWSQMHRAEDIGLRPPQRVLVSSKYSFKKASPLCFGHPSLWLTLPKPGPFLFPCHLFHMLGLVTLPART